MGYRKKMIWVPILLMLLACVMPAVQASATDADGLWVRMHADDGSFIASICVNTTVTDGMIELQYDSSLITFTEVVVDSQYVAAHAVNAEKPGIVTIAWVAPGDYGLDGNVHILMQARFTNAEGAVVALAGAAHAPDGREIPATELKNFTVISALAAAGEYKAEDYTAESFAALKRAIENAWAAMEDLYTSQADMDAAAEAVMAAIDGLERAPVVVPTEPTQPTQPASKPTQPATQPTQPATQPVDPQPEPKPGNGLWIGIVAAVAVAGAAVAVIIKKKEVRK